MRIILTVALMAIAGLAVVTITTGNPTNRLTHSDVTAEQMQAKFTAWVVDHTYDYVTVNKVACAASRRYRTRGSRTLRRATPTTG